jgi:hypothetical protein
MVLLQADWADHGVTVTLRRANFFESAPMGMVTVMVSGSLPFSTTVTPGLELSVSAPMR